MHPGGGRMKTILVSSPRGGSGKTTLAVHLAIAAELRREVPVVLLDTDPLAFALDCCEVRRRRLLDTPGARAVRPSNIMEVLVELEGKGVRYAIVDTPPSTLSTSPELLSYGDLVLVPASPSVWELPALERSLPAIRDAARSFAFVWCRATKVVRKNQSAGLKELAMFGQVFRAAMRERVIYTEPFVHGYSAFEDKRHGDPASEDILAIWAEVRERLATTSEPQPPTKSDNRSHRSTLRPRRNKLPKVSNRPAFPFE
jgi:chromosome partitioning protein